MESQSISLIRKSSPSEAAIAGVLLKTYSYKFCKIPRRHLCQSLFLHKVAGPWRLWHRFFPVNFVKSLRAPILQNTSGRLFLLLPLWLKCRVVAWPHIERKLILYNSVAFVQFKKREKHPWRSVTFSKAASLACNSTKSNNSPWVFFTFSKLYKPIRATQNIYSSLIIV